MQSTEQFPPRTDAPQVTPLGRRPALPAQQITADSAPLLRDIDWNGHMPTAPRGPVTLPRAQVSGQLAASDGGDWDRGPAIPKFPGQRRSTDAPSPKVPGQRPAAQTPIGLAFGEHAARAAFGSVA